MPFARLARRPRLGATLCAIAAFVGITGCHSVPIVPSANATAVRAIDRLPNSIPLLRGQDSDRETRSLFMRDLHVDESELPDIPWGHVRGENMPTRNRELAPRAGTWETDKRQKPSSQIAVNQPVSSHETNFLDQPNAEIPRRRLDLTPAPTGRMALNDFNNPIGPASEPDWIDPGPRQTVEPSAAVAEFNNCHSISWRDDACNLFPMLWDDTVSLVNWRTAIALGAAAGGAIAIRENLDARVRDHTSRNPQKWGEASEVLRQFGEFQYQVPVIAGVYGLSVWTGDDHLHEFGLSLISAYTLSSVATVAIKGITNTQRPTNVYQDGEYGFPSFHTSSTFSIASVIDEYYGWKAGIPAYVLAGLVGWSRIDQQEHDLSDVFFGAALGFVIGKTVSAAHIERHSNVQVMPYYDPAQQAGGVIIEKRY